MLLCDLHSACLGGDGQAMAAAMQLALDANFGSVERWRAGFVAMGKATGGGWLVLSFDPRTGMLHNHRCADDTAAAAAGEPLLAVDRPEDTDRLDWAAVYARYQQAVGVASEPFSASHDDLSAAEVFDVRRAAVFDAAPTRIPGAAWRNPATVGTWSCELPAARDVVVYCVHGHEVSRATALRLRARGVNARYLQGGIAGWQAAGRPVEALTPSPSGRG